MTTSASASPSASLPGESSRALRVLAAAAALTGWTALLLQLWLTVGVVIGQGRGWPMGLVVYFGFFTILTNLLATLALSAWRIGSGFPGHRRLTSPVTLTTAAAAITVVGLVYFFILRHTWKPEGAQFVADAVLHYVMPVLTVLFWVGAVPARAIGWAQAPWLLVYPLAYLAYVFARGEVVGLYPYEFIDVLKIGYPAALRNSALIIVAYALLVGVYTGLKALVSGQNDLKGLRS
jgi:hypothetical protein